MTRSLFGAWKNLEELTGTCVYQAPSLKQSKRRWSTCQACFGLPVLHPKADQPGSSKIQAIHSEVPIRLVQPQASSSKQPCWIMQRGGSICHLRALEQGLGAFLSRQCFQMTQSATASAPSAPLPHPAPVLTTGLPIRSGLDKEDIEGRRQVSGRLILLVSLVVRHEQVLLHWEGSLYATEVGLLFFHFRLSTYEHVAA